MELQFQMNQLINLAIGSPEIFDVFVCVVKVGAVNFNLLQRFLLEMLKMTDLDSATVTFSPDEVSRFGENTLKPVAKESDDTKTEEELLPKKSGFHQCPIDPQKVDQLLEEITQLKFDMEDLAGKVKTMEGSTETVPFQEMRRSLSQIDGLQEKIKQLEDMLENVKNVRMGEDEGSMSQRLGLVETTLMRHNDQLTEMNGVLDEKLPYITDQFADLQQEMGILSEKFNIASSNTILAKRSMAASRVSIFPDPTTNSINNIIARISSLQHDLDNMNLLTNNLTEEQEQRQMRIDSLMEQIDFLKITKADKTNMEDFLAAKADKSQVHRKVSHNYFETEMERLSAKMEDAFNRLDVHEDTWQEEMESLKVDIGSKMDKAEFSPLKEFVNEKLKHIQDKMKYLAAERKSQEAAGSKKKIIRDVQCISCDNDSVMRPETSLQDMMPPPPLPVTQSVKPFLTYKLDQVRKQQQKLPGKNLHHFEEMLHAPALSLQTKLPISKNGVEGGYLVNRYVGGSHTTTTPQQRVTRTGNFYQTWAPIVTAVNPLPSQQPAA